MTKPIHLYPEAKATPIERVMDYALTEPRDLMSKVAYLYIYMLRSRAFSSGDKFDLGMRV